MLLGDALFKRLAYIDDLVVKGNINNKKFNEVLDDIVYLDEDIVLTNMIKFHKPVSKINFSSSLNNYELCIRQSIN